MPDRDEPASAIELSIGSLSSATGVPVDTLRTWERRYGFPTPVARTEGSHRRYAAETVEVVQLIVKALERGHRPSTVIGRGAPEIRRMLAVGTKAFAPQSIRRDERATVERWIAMTLALDSDALSSDLALSLSDMAVIDFLEHRVAPFLAEVGRRWARGELRISHEHFASERVREFLAARWHELADGLRRDAHSIVLATPSGEHHVLGLHMAAWIISRAEARVVFLGANTPIDELAFAAKCHSSRGVVLSIAEGYSGDVVSQLKELAACLPEDVRIAVGGAGARQTARSAQYLNSFSALLDWTRQLQ